MTTTSMQSPRRIAVVTGSRAEFGLLRPVMTAIQNREDLQLHVIAAGSHLLPPQNTIEEVRTAFPNAASVPMQSTGQHSRTADAESLGKGISAFAKSFADLQPDLVLVLGDRIEAFAAAAAASVSGFRVAHMHGGDRAEGIADEAMRHAITKLAHLHLPATQKSAMRIIAMGEPPERVHIVGSPAIDGLNNIAPTTDADFAALGNPQIVVLLHPTGDDEQIEHDRAAKLLSIAKHNAPTLVLHPNHDPGRNGIIRAIESSNCRNINHLPRDKFIALLRRAKLILGNSSAGLIECAAIPICAINLGPRQAGREKPANVTDIPNWDYQTIQSAIAHALSAPPLTAQDVPHPYGDGHAGLRTAEILATFDPAACSVRKQNSY